MTIHEKLDNILDATVSTISPIIIDKRNHVAAGSMFSHTYTLNNAGNYRYLLILLAGFSNVANSVTNSLTTSSGTVLTLFTEYGETNGGACVSLGLYLIDNPTNGMTIDVYTTQSAIEKIWGI